MKIGFDTLEQACGFKGVVVSESTFKDNAGNERKRMTLTKPTGKSRFVVIQYEDFSYSRAIQLPKIK